MRVPRQGSPCSAALVRVAHRCNVRLFQGMVHQHKLANATSEEITATLEKILLPVARAQVRQAKALGLSNKRIYVYYASVSAAVTGAWNRKWRHPLWSWASQAVISIVTFLVDIYDAEAIEEDGELKPAIVVKALAIALKEL
ncbi:hypothetical protein PMIN03_002523 [Paraphaeosphaeria minitans]